MTPKKKTAYISLQHVTKNFLLTSGIFTALDDINIDFRSSEFTCVVGRSGSGKSTLMNMITGIDKPTDGKIVVAGKPIQDFTENERARWRGENLGIVFQFYQLIPVLSLLENVMLPMQLLGKTDLSKIEKKALRLLAAVNLEDQAHQRPEKASGGQQQCAAIARALANDPPILIADEPTGNLGSEDATMVLGIFIDLVKKGKTVIMVTHDDDLAKQADRTLRLSDGRVVGDSNHAHRKTIARSRKSSHAE
ncbi:MAG: ABC transporter ATP-binding protein [Chloroflexi bacterium]|jgi:putative ABC transport system ATP-binding protein|nr:ABC transporter ATP-binding protein [Chloroflexota bacterium]